jgi:hypothetical protein
MNGDETLLTGAMALGVQARLMSLGFHPQIGRRDVVRALIGAASAAAASAAPLAPAAADTESDSEKRKARYRADAPDVETFYRVNRYPAS